MNPVQGLLGVRGGDAAAARFSQEAAQALRAGVQEDFELFEASDNEDEMEKGTANESQGGKPSLPTLLHACSSELDQKRPFVCARFWQCL